MPISGGKYVAPTWVDNAPPALGATELQAISDSVASYADPVAQITWFTRPNLLDNWYFVGGGSQQGGGQFPINQGGQTSYSGSVQNTIDRWRTSNANTTIAITSSGLTNSASSGSTPYLLQLIPNIDPLRGKKVTFSALVSGTVYSASATIPATNPASTTTYATVTGVGHILYLSGSWYLRLSGPSGGSISFSAVKLEIGSTQTLAHQENGSWVLNEVPNFDEQYMRCVISPDVPMRVEYGSYTGTGTYGSANPNTLTFGFVPKTVIVREESASWFQGLYAIDNCTSTRTYLNANYYVSLIWSGTSLQWYNTSSASYQLNSSSKTYCYIAIG